MKLSKSKYLLIAVVLVVIGAVSVAYYLNVHRSANPTTTSQIPAGAIPTGDGSYAIKTTIPGQMKFVSPKLGISFLYIGAQAKEVGNRVYLYTSSYQDYTNSYGLTYTKGRYIEVFNKNRSESLEQAITETILKQYSSSDCSVKVIDYKNTSSDNKTYVYIAFPYENNPQTMEPFFKAASKCPSPYTQLNDSRDFVLDKTHPDKFIFRNLGQSDYVGEVSKDGKTVKTWSDTIQFIH